MTSIYGCLKFQKPSINQIGSMVDKHALGSPAGNSSLTNFKSNEKHFWPYSYLYNPNFN